MTEITVIRGENGRLLGLRGEGHSGQASRGDDIVCASITTVFEFLSERAGNLPESALIFRQEADGPRWHVEIDPDELTEYQGQPMVAFLRTALDVLRNIAEQHPEHCRLIEDPETD